MKNLMRQSIYLLRGMYIVRTECSRNTTPAFVYSVRYGFQLYTKYMYVHLGNNMIFLSIFKGRI
jgi:hypothetical protein